MVISASQIGIVCHQLYDLCTCSQSVKHSMEKLKTWRKLTAS